MIAMLARFRENRKATVAVEFAVIAPIMILLYFGMDEASNMVRAYTKFTYATQALADMIAQEPQSTSVSIGDLMTGINLELAPYGTTFLCSAQSVTNTNGTTPAANDWATARTCTGTAPSGATTSVYSLVTSPTNLVPVKGDSVIVVQASFTFTGFSSYIIKQTSFTFRYTAYSTPRISTVPLSEPSA